MTPSAKQKIGIVGLGLLGGSLALALKGKPVLRLAWDRTEQTLENAVENGAVDIPCPELETLLADADIVVLALPVPVIKEFMEKYAEKFSRNSIVTDIGSTKSSIMETAQRFLAPHGVTFIGSHPMAGTEKSGFDNAFSSLYENAECFITPAADSKPEKVESLRAFWAMAGMKITILSPEEHDRLVGHTSHLAHLLAMVLNAQALGTANEKEKMLRYAGCATGFRDTSRIASSSPTMWREIIENNQQAVLEAMDGFAAHWEELRELIAQGRFDQFEEQFAKGKKMRDDWMAYKKSTGKW